MKLYILYIGVVAFGMMACEETITATTVVDPNPIREEERIRASGHAVMSRYGSMPTNQLWQMHRAPASPLDLAAIEAELGARGESRNGSDHVGKVTANAHGRSLYSRGQARLDGKNCSDFSSSAQAQKYFLQAGGPLSDPYDLDRDGDGLACEWGTYVDQVARANRPRPVAVAPTPSSRCYTGPRGGTYTLTASGNKNYDGC